MDGAFELFRSHAHPHSHRTPLPRLINIGSWCGHQRGGTQSAVDLPPTHMIMPSLPSNDEQLMTEQVRLTSTATTAAPS